MITENMISQAAAELNEAMLNCLPEATACNHNFSPRFQKRMKRVLHRLKHPIRHRVIQRVACVLLVMLLSFASFLAISPTVRAAVFGWIREQYESFIEYYFPESLNHGTEPTTYQLPYIPEGYEEFGKSEQSSGITIYYANHTNDRLMYFGYSTEPDFTAYRVDIEAFKLETASVNGNSADIFISTDPSQANAIVWIDSKTNTYFCISAYLEKEELIYMAENILRIS